MALKAKVMGREALTKRLNELVPNAEKYAAEAKLAVAKQAAEMMREKAPTGATLEYRESFSGEPLSANPDKRQVGITPTKDASATGIYAEWIWRFLEFGTAPHNTAPGGGNKSYKGVVHMHPGTQPQAHIFPTWRAYRKKASAKIRAAINKAVREAMGK